MSTAVLNRDSSGEAAVDERAGLLPSLKFAEPNRPFSDHWDEAHPKGAVHRTGAVGQLRGNRPHVALTHGHGSALSPRRSGSLLAESGRALPHWRRKLRNRRSEVRILSGALSTG